MTCCQDENCQCHGNSSFVFGLIVGAFLAAAVIILSSKDKAKIIRNIKTKLAVFFKDKAPEIKEIKKKISVIIPKDLTPTPSPAVPKKPVKLFKKK